MSFLGGELTHDETTIISGALDMSQKSAKDAMTPVSEIFSLDINSRLDEYVFLLLFLFAFRKFIFSYSLLILSSSLGYTERQWD